MAVWKAKQPGFSFWREVARHLISLPHGHTKNPPSPTSPVPISASNAARDRRPKRRGARTRLWSQPQAPRASTPRRPAPPPPTRLPVPARAQRGAPGLHPPLPPPTVRCASRPPPSAWPSTSSLREIDVLFLGFRRTPARSPDRMSWLESWNH